MIAHVAEAGENSGRVILQMPAYPALSRTALMAALHVAKSFNAGLESLVCEDPQLVDFASFQFAREVSGGGVLASTASVAGIEAALHQCSVLCHGDVVATAEAANIPVYCRTNRDEPLAAIAASCAENGPWNVVVLGEPIAVGTESLVVELFETIADVTGVVAVGTGAAQTLGPVIAVIEQLAHVQPMLRAAERLAGARNDVHLVLFGGNADATAWMEGQVRLLLSDDSRTDLVLSPDVSASPEALALVIQALHAGFVIAQLGGDLLPPGGGLDDFARCHDGPLFLVR